MGCEGSINRVNGDVEGKCGRFVRCSAGRVVCEAQAGLPGYHEHGTVCSQSLMMSQIMDGSLDKAMWVVVVIADVVTDVCSFDVCACSCFVLGPVAIICWEGGLS